MLVILQLRPVFGNSIPASAVAGNLQSSALARQFLSIQLEGQYRSQDSHHTSNIDAIRNSKEECPIESHHMEPYKILRASHVLENPELFMTPVLTTNNKARRAIIKERMALYAFQSRQVVITYNTPIIGHSQAIIGNLTSKEFTDLCDEYPELLGRFCMNCPVMELRNVSICHGT
jgi:hypothetical protein